MIHRNSKVCLGGLTWQKMRVGKMLGLAAERCDLPAQSLSVFYRSNRGVRVYVVLFAAPAITLLRNREIFPTPKIIVRGRKALLTVAGVKKWWEVSEASWEPVT